MRTHSACDREPSQVAAEWAAPVIARAKADGYLERRIRARLAPFYESYERRVTRPERSAHS